MYTRIMVRRRPTKLFLPVRSGGEKPLCAHRTGNTTMIVAIHFEEDPSKRRHRDNVGTLLFHLSIPSKFFFLRYVGVEKIKIK